MLSARATIVVAAVNGALAVMLGAFGAHGLKSRVDEQMLTVWQTAGEYHLAHALVLLALGLWMRQGGRGTAAAWAMLIGITLFSGSLYLMVLSGERALGMITPLGGIAFIVGWLLLAVAAWNEGRAQIRS